MMKGVTDALVLTVGNLANSLFRQRQSNKDAPMVYLHTSLSCVPCKGYVSFGGIYTYVGFSALLVPTTWAMRRPLLRGTGNRLAPRFLYPYVNENQHKLSVRQPTDIGFNLW